MWKDGQVFGQELDTAAQPLLITAVTLVPNFMFSAFLLWMLIILK